MKIFAPSSFLIWTIMGCGVSLAANEYCITGFAMDKYCIEMGTLFDNPSLVSLQYPDEHSIHCLVDVPECVSSGYEILTDPLDGDTNYVRAVSLDSSGNDMVVTMAREVGSCGTCNGNGTQLKGFRATFVGTLEEGGGGDNDPPRLLVSRVVSDTVGCASITSSTPTSMAPSNPTSGSSRLDVFASRLLTATLVATCLVM